MLHVTGARAQITQDQVIAVYLYNFLSFVTWEDSSPYDICVYKDNKIIENLHKIKWEQTVHIDFNIREIKSHNSINNCNILFLGDIDKSDAEDIINATRNTSSLTVSSFHDFLKLGGIVEFKVFSDRIQLSINNTKANKYGIKISSRLLKICDEVR